MRAYAKSFSPRRIQPVGLRPLGLVSRMRFCSNSRKENSALREPFIREEPIGAHGLSFRVNHLLASDLPTTVFGHLTRSTTHELLLPTRFFFHNGQMRQGHGHLLVSNSSHAPTASRASTLDRTRNPVGARAIQIINYYTRKSRVQSVVHIFSLSL
ncbi:hypothetical protein BDV93DRAFT_299043 [Ceratobasidium sp. AG-I]|nr:hypothetical protein BDV93DRAFT_299043 [Ceratobasidium sp. AG-I]